MTGRALTSKQLGYAELRASGVTRAEAARRHGYDRRRAAELDSDPRVLEIVAAAKERAVSRVSCTVEDVIERLWSISTDAMERKEYDAAIKAAVKVGEHLGMWREADQAKSPKLLPGSVNVALMYADLRGEAERRGLVGAVVEDGAEE